MFYDIFTYAQTKQISSNINTVYKENKETMVPMRF